MCMCVCILLVHLHLHWVLVLLVPFVIMAVMVVMIEKIEVGLCFGPIVVGYRSQRHLQSNTALDCAPSS